MAILITWDRKQTEKKGAPQLIKARQLPKSSSLEFTTVLLSCVLCGNVYTFLKEQIAEWTIQTM